MCRGLPECSDHRRLKNGLIKMPAMRVFFIIKYMINEMKTNAKEKIEDLQFAELQFIQSDTVLKFGTDAVLLSSFIALKEGEHFVEFGTGSGIIPVLLSGRVRTKMTAIELQEQAAALARRNMALNELDHVQVICGDLKQATTLVHDHVDVVAVNPPYEPANSGAKSEKEAFLLARHEVACTLRDVVQSASKLLKQGGRFYMVHKPWRLAEILSVMQQYNLEPKQMRLVANKSDSAPHLVLIKGICGGNVGLEVLPTLTLHEVSGAETKELQEIYHRESQI